MDVEDAHLGTGVLVQLDYRKPHRQGAVGTIRKRYGTRHYTAFEVLFPDGNSQLFWEYQLEEARERSSREKWWWFSRSKLSERT